MEPSDTTGTPSAPGPAGEPAGSLSRPAEAARAEARGAGRLWMTALAAGVVAGAIAWLGGEAAYEFFPAPVATSTFGSLSAAELRQLMRVNIQNAALAFGLLGATLGLALGLAGGIVRRSARAAAVAAAVGLVVGGLVAAGTTVAALMARGRALESVDEDNLLLALASHAAIWSAIGAAGGLALGLGLGGRGRIGPAVLGGLLGAAGATVLYEMVGGLTFPLAATNRPLAITGSARLLARLLVATLTAAGAAWAVRSAERPPKAVGGG
jgi:hypothetical protein